MRTADRRGPRPAALIVLAVAALAGIATSPGAPSLSDSATAEFTIDGGSTVDRRILIHLATDRTLIPTQATLWVGLRSAGDFGDASSDQIDITVSRPDGVPAPRDADDDRAFGIPVTECKTGCDLEYIVRFAADPSVSSGALVRYRADVRFGFEYGTGPDVGTLTVEIVGGEASTPSIAWLLVVLIAGVVLGLVLGRRLPASRRVRSLLPVALIAALIIGAVWAVAGWSPTGAALLSVALLLGHAVGLGLGLRRWSSDQGWLLGAAGVSTISLCGLWLIWWVGSFVVVHPVELAVAIGALSGIAGAVVGVSWGAGHAHGAARYAWPALAVISQGLLIVVSAAFGLASAVPILWFDSPLFGPEALLALSPLAIAAGLVVGLWRWVDGSRWLMFAMNLLVAALGSLALLAWLGLRFGFLPPGTSPPPIDLADVLVLLPLAAALVGMLVSTRRFSTPRTGLDRDDPAVFPIWSGPTALEPPSSDEGEGAQ